MQNSFAKTTVYFATAFHKLLTFKRYQNDFHFAHCPVLKNQTQIRFSTSYRRRSPDVYEAQ